MKRAHRRSGRGVALLLLTLIAGTGCLGRSPAPRLYTLRAVQGAVVGGAEPDVALSVGPVSLPHYLAIPQIVTRQGANEVVIDEFRRWAGGLEANVLRVLAENLGQRLETRRVVAAPAAAPFPIDYQLVVDFDELVGGAGGELLLAARWVIRNGAGVALSVESSSLTEPLGDRGVDALIAAHERALGQLADTVAARIVELSQRDATDPAASVD